MAGNAFRLSKKPVQSIVSLSYLPVRKYIQRAAQVNRRKTTESTVMRIHKRHD
jgi:hypothetical protein